MDFDFEEKYFLKQEINNLLKYQEFIHLLLESGFVKIIMDWVTPPIDTFIDLLLGLQIITKLLTFNKHIDQKMLEFGLIERLESLTASTVLTGETECKKCLCTISVNLQASDSMVAKEFRNSKLPTLLLNFFCDTPGPSLLNELLD